MVTRRTQKSCYFDDETVKAVQELADSDNRSFAYMIEVLVKEALAARAKQ
jgi:predicted transcriptional regulator